MPQGLKWDREGMSLGGGVMHLCSDDLNANEGPVRKKQKTGKKGTGGQRSQGGMVEEEEEEKEGPPRRLIAPTRGAGTLAPPVAIPAPLPTFVNPCCWRDRGNQPPGTGFNCSVLGPSPS